MEQQIIDKLNKIEMLTMLAAKQKALTLDDVAVLTGLSKSHIYKLTCTGGIPFYKPNKHLYFDRGEIEAWMLSAKVMSTEEAKAEAANYIVTKAMSQKKGARV